MLVGEALKLDARCSQGNPSGGGDPIANYEWDLGDGRTRSGPDQAFISPRWNVAGDYTVTLTVTDSGGSSTQRSFGIAQSQEGLQDSISKRITIRPSVSLEACFMATGMTMCRVQFNASCSTPNEVIDRYDWVLDETNVLARATDTGIIVTHDWGGSCWDDDIRVRLTVSGKSGDVTLSHTIVETVNVSYYLRSPFLQSKQIATSFTSYLGIAPFDGSARGQVMLNGTRTDSVDSSSPFQHRAQGKFGENTIEAFVPTPTDQPGFWRFDFGGADGFVAGSIKIQSGQVISSNSKSVVFRVSGAPGERIKFTFELLP